MLLFLAFWEMVVALQWVNPLFTSSPSRIVRAAYEMFADGSILEQSRSARTSSRSATGSPS